ncbi:hypothetical protein L486_00575 [Kwoniella mangroviensis CBS 10435]|uniref:Short-chain dehydrogenase n=1 Tax=Kwoniella mangroviensis CBS 10435 TaxID=1331196 RepID=A0A1B9IZG4_9TREE|nr:hypothetical protein L486_00575 [Kwoniella mangroviensis CBS 10435]
MSLGPNTELKTKILITGANTGIGYETCLALLRSQIPYTIFLGSRSRINAENAIKKLHEQINVDQSRSGSDSEVIPVVVDLESDESISACYEEVKSRTDKLDVLVNNAGAAFDGTGPKNGMSQREIFNRTFNINVTGTHVMTQTFIPLLFNSTNPRILFLTSGSASLTRTEDTSFSLNKSPGPGWPKEEDGEGGYLSYKSSKLALNMIMRDWIRLLRNDDKFKVWSINPGTVLTGLGGDKEQLKKWNAKSPDTSGIFIRNVIEGKRDDQVGKSISPPGAPSGDILPW